MTVDKAALLGKRTDTGSGFPEADVEIPGFGTVRVRGLSRWEVLHAQRVQNKGPAVMEQVTVSMGLVDPVMTEDEVKAWQRVATAGELDPVTARIGELSGMFDGAAKAAYKEFDADASTEFRPLPSSETVDAGSGDAPENPE